MTAGAAADAFAARQPSAASEVRVRAGPGLVEAISSLGWPADASGCLLAPAIAESAEYAVVAVPVLGASGEALGTSTVTYPVDMLKVVHGEIIETADVSSAGMDGWIQRYVISVEGEEIEVQVWCSGTAEALASHDDELRAVVKDRGKSWAIRAAEHAQPGRGAKALVRCDSTGVSTRYEYAHPVRSLFSPIRFVFRDSVTSISASEFDALVEELRGEGDLGAQTARALLSARARSGEITAGLSVVNADAVAAAIDRLGEKGKLQPGLRRLRDNVRVEYGEPDVGAT